MADNISSVLAITPAAVPDLPATLRESLVAHLLRWQQWEAARRVLQQLLVTHSNRVSIYDDLAHVYLALGQPHRALEIMDRRHALRASNSSRLLEARVHLAAGDLSAAQAIVGDLVASNPDMLTARNVQVEICLASGNLQGASAAIEHREALQPEAAATAQLSARLWQTQGDDETALLWARTALARCERDQLEPSVELLRLLESLYRATGQAAQADATADRLRQRQESELAGLRQALGLVPPAAEPPAPPPIHPPAPPLPAAPRADVWPTEVIAGAVDLTPGERTRLDQALRAHFPHDAFRAGQADVIAAILRGESVLAVMPTGAGKSLCYQLAALLLPGTTLVISPLIALMKDQLDGLPAGVAHQATTLNSTLDGAELEARLAQAVSGKYKLVYAAPERLRQRPFLHALKRAGVFLLVVDEAHCVSLWGHDFRPDYLFIAKAWQDLGKPPILAMTATATPRVRDDIQSALGQMRLVAADVHRPNLHLEARRFGNEAEKRRALLQLSRQLEGSGIVYARSRKKCEELAQALLRNGVSAIHYHAGIEDRAAAQDRFMNNEARVVVATIAFGMGVDKADVRFVLHYDPPRALENYYQEAGRAGRDGLPARCFLFHTPGDRAILTRWAHQGALRVEFLREVYAGVQCRLGPHHLGLVAAADLERDLAVEDTQLRVAIHFLETAGLLWRGFDLPRTAVLKLDRAPAGEASDLARFIAAGRLLPGQAVSRDLLALSQEAALDPRTIEGQVLAWQEEGWLRYRGAGRDMLLALPQAPHDSSQRVAAMLADYSAGQAGRIAEMMAYALTTRCRHGAISAYFGGRAIERCEACDNCLGTVLHQPQSQSPRRVLQPAVADVDVTWAILTGILQLPFALGCTGLARALKGASTSPVPADRFPLFGALAGRTRKGIGELIAQLEEQGFLEHFEARGYPLLRLTAEGRAWLSAHPQARAPIPRPEPTASGPRLRPDRAQRPTPPNADDPGEYDQAIFEQLRAWRRGVARQAGKAPYVVFHDSTLRELAACRPTNTEELAAVRGIGPGKLEQYGALLLAIIAGQGAAIPEEGR